MSEEGPEDPRLEAIYEKLDKMDPTTFDKRAGELLFGLGFSQTMMRRNTCDMSGGWRMRVALAQALFVRPMLLVLDEPTNHLDLGACVWLEDYLAKWDSILILTSHSADFLNGVCSKMYHLTVRATRFQPANAITSVDESHSHRCHAATAVMQNRRHRRQRRQRCHHSHRRRRRHRCYAAC